MLLQKYLRTFLVIPLLFIYYLLFWHEKLGINLVIFSSVLMGAALLLFPQSASSKKVWITIAGTLLSGIMVVVYNAALAKTMHILSFFIAVGYIHQPLFKTTWHPSINMMANYALAPIHLMGKLNRRANGNKRMRVAFLTLKLSVVPLIVGLVFIALYSGANPKFNTLMNESFGWLVDFMATLSFAKISFLLLGTILIFGAIYYAAAKVFGNDIGGSDQLERKRLFSRGRRFSMLALKNENRMGIILLITVNFLLLIANIIDINWIWLGFSVPENFSLKSFVHEGTYLLILSMLLSIGILLLLFRRNLNFYRNNKTLKILAHLWIGQNMVLGISVLLRNYHYISFHGLAYGRIMVLIFLLLTFIGLFTLFLKINKVKSFFYLLRVNSWSFYLVLVMACVVNWDQVIVDHNLHHSNLNEIDTDNYYFLSPKVLPTVYENLDRIAAQMESHQYNRTIWVSTLDIEEFKKMIDGKSRRFIEEYERHDWPSWTLAEQQTYAYLKERIEL